MVGVPYPTRQKNEGKNLGRKHPELSKKRRVFARKKSEYFSAFSLYGEYGVRSFLPDGVFLPCDHGLDFFTSAYVRIQSINQRADAEIPRL